MSKEKIEEVIKPLFTKIGLIAEVEHLVKFEGMGYAESMIHICIEKEVEPEDLAKLVKKENPLKEKLRVEGQRNNTLPKPTTKSLY